VNYSLVKESLKEPLTHGSEKQLKDCDGNILALVVFGNLSPTRPYFHSKNPYFIN
jgi:hypothetical protein